jgi:hypothetical protein
MPLRSASLAAAGAAIVAAGLAVGACGSNVNVDNHAGGGGGVVSTATSETRSGVTRSVGTSSAGTSSAGTGGSGGTTDVCGPHGNACVMYGPPIYTGGSGGVGGGVATGGGGVGGTTDVCGHGGNMCVAYGPAILDAGSPNEPDATTEDASTADAASHVQDAGVKPTADASTEDAATNAADSGTDAGRNPVCGSGGNMCVAYGPAIFDGGL